MSTTLPVLAPRLPGCPPAVDDRTYTKEHTEEEWEAMREVIKRLYIRDNRKLNETMAILQARHGFAATEQMFKKRLKKWNLRKRTYRKSPSGSTASTPAQIAEAYCQSAVTAETETVDDQTAASSSSPEEQSPEEVNDTSMALIRPSNNAGPYANLEQVLGSVFSWSQSKLDTYPVASDPMSRYLANPNHPPIQDSRTMYRTFELVFDLWYHGKGNLAGLAARRGFYVLEFVLSEDHPDLVWHVLDTIFDMLNTHSSGFYNNYGHVIINQIKGGVTYAIYYSSDPQRLWLYEQLIWDGRTRLRKGSELAKRQDAMYHALETMAEAQDHGPTVDDSDRLRIEALRLEFTQMDVGDKKKAEELALNLLNHTSSDTGMGSRSSDRFHAYARKMLARVQQDRQEWDTAEQNLQYAIYKREAAHGTLNNLRVIRDMWVLAAHYQKAGRQGDADAITSDALSRAQLYLEQGTS
ncbi:uncharacterized protein NECHADRAFT_74679 [Fusarium vanettenii 77-13-4]|uniref:Clr5 domain-containing protein n=1 Tax=Fusarium vanettenii (strain ATCC MYA-4622 / CBS 123669 / FGSC 9596 / NRRL 45880 / 77-13-4) TaxID=660122 RepID=C7YKP4_FUSV7|nr:uncharacterized protein NECHADRAFT_74679 [Fusarium vanettenii 77-13-4]EEU48487.1 hypothetical protein NECHADRAFT_74679 [Fusarium vanettenii 77-13-4]